MPRLHHIPRPELAAAITSLAVALVLLIVKFIAFYLTGSSAIFSDALESIVNVLAALFAAFSLHLAHRPADAKHPYGHGKIEFMSAGFEGGMILLAAILIIARAVEALISGPQVEKINIGLALIIAAGAINGIVGLYLVHAGRRSNAITLTAGGTHLLSDAMTSVAVIVALLLVKVTRMPVIDPIVAILVAVYLVRLASQLLTASAAGLMDEQDVADTQLLRGILDSHVGAAAKSPRICSYHKLRHRHSGRYHWVDFHIMVPADLDVARGHEIASAIEFEIEQALVEANATAHVEPCTDANCAHAPA
jgi:cation diffusion facilitator family transporter